MIGKARKLLCKHLLSVWWPNPSMMFCREKKCCKTSEFSNTEEVGFAEMANSCLFPCASSPAVTPRCIRLIRVQIARALLCSPMTG